MNVYDFDKTIYNGDSTRDFYLYSLIKHPEMLKYVPNALSGAFSHYISKSCTKTQFKQKMYTFLTCVDVQKDVPAFWSKNRHKIKTWYLRQKRKDDVIISASPRFLLEPVCAELGVRFLIASEVDPITGEYSGVNCHGTEKVRRFYEMFPQGRIDAFYSDSQSDRPLRDIASSAFLVTGDRLTDWD